MVTKEIVKSLLASKGIRIESELRLGNGTGWQLKCSDGVSVNIFDNGKYNVQGRNSDQIKIYLKELDEKSAIARCVFVVYGHDQRARDELETLLLRWNIRPLILDQLPTGGMTLIEKLEQYQQKVNFAIVLATPDDEGHKAGNPSEKAYRARQNVVLELGMMLARLGRPRVAILIKDQEKMERPSDIQGLIYIPFKDSVEDAKITLAKEMTAQGLLVDLQKL